MILFGSHELLPCIEFNGYTITNLSSMIIKYPRMVNILPNQYTNFMSDEFVNQYQNYLLYNRMNVFVDIIVPSIVQGNDLYVLVTRNAELDCITEIIQHFILTRYGIVSYLVNTIDDIINLETTQTNDTIMRYPHHMQNFDDDLKVYWSKVL